MKTKYSKEKPILMVDDNPVETLIAKRNYSRSKLENEFITFDNGDSLIDYLKNLSELPLVIFVDINMPVKNGFEVVKEIRAMDVVGNQVCIHMLSNSSNPKDKDNALSSGADDFHTKPSSNEEYINMFNSLKS